MTVRVLLTGASGQLGNGVQRAWLRQGRHPADLIALDRTHLDITRPLAAGRAVAELRPSVVINAAALTRVDECESNQLQALRVNAGGPSLLAAACRDVGATLLQISTDYVFDGTAREPYTEDASPRPVNVYGASKLLGERAVRRALPDRHLILRTSGLYGEPLDRKPRNFVATILDQALRGEAARVVTDQVCSPTSAHDLAAVLLRLVDAEARGTVHVTNRGSCSWYEFACAALSYAGLRSPVRATTSARLGRVAPRPAYSVLANSRLREYGIEGLRPWQEALREYVEAYQAGLS